MNGEQWKFYADGWENILTGIGTSRDKRTGGRASTAMPNQSFDEYENLYLSDDIARTVVDTPSQEMVKTWITLQTDEDSSLVSKYIEQNQMQSKVYESLVWSQVFGGSLLFLGIDDGVKDLILPLNEKNMRTFDFFSVFDRWDVDVYSYYDNMKHPKFGLPMIYRIKNTPSNPIGLDTVGEKLVHESRFLRFDGAMVTRRRRLRNAGWADSIYVRLSEVIRDFGLAYGSVSNLMQDFAQAIFKMKGLAEALIADKDKLVLRRIQLMDIARSTARVLPIDGESEDFSRTVTPTTGLPDLLDRFALRLAAAARMPVTLLMGDSPSGMNATGDSDMRFFFDHIKSRQEKELRPNIHRLLTLIYLTKSGPTGGKLPKNWGFVFNPLWQLSDTEMVKNKNTQAQTDQIYVNSGVLSPDEIAQSRFKGGRYSTETTLNPATKRDKEAKSAAAAGAEGLDDKSKPSPKDTPKGGG